MGDQEDLSGLLENASLGLAWLDPSGVIVDANQAELDLGGYSRNEYIGRNFAEFHVDRAAIGDILLRLGNKEKVRDYEAWRQRKDGSLGCVQIGATGRWEDGKFVHALCLSHDITDRKRREERLMTQGGVARVLAAAATFEEAAPDLLEQVGKHLGWCAGYMWVRQDQVLRCAAFWVDDTERYRGFPEQCEQSPFDAELLPNLIWNSRKPHWYVDGPGDRTFPRSDIAARLGLHSAFGFPVLLGEETQAVMEFFSDELRAPDRELLEMSAAAGRQIGEFLERIKVRQSLAEREESYRVLTETASDGIVTIDSAGEILFANSPAARMFGYTSEELLGMDLTALMPEHLRPVYADGISSDMATGALVHLTGLHRHGYEFPLEISFGEYRQGSKHIFVGVLRDATERTRLEEKMRQAAKLESLGVMAGGIAHDFNNLLTGILGNVSLAEEMLPGNHPAKSPLADAMKASERAADLTRQMLAYTGKGKIVIQPIDISELVREISSLVKASIPRHVGIRLDLDKTLPSVEADGSQLQQLVMNLVINGAEAVPADRQGMVLIKTRLQRVQGTSAVESGEVEPGQVEPGDYVEISVQDNGSGMDDATRTKIFDPFFTTKFTGRGLGLAAAAGIIKGHKGVLRLFSAPGQGTTFRVLLPVSHKNPQDARPAQIAEDLTGAGTVLVVDDEEVVRKIAATTLRAFGYTVVTADNGRTGVERFREIHEELAAVILDVAMPVMNGEQALQVMKTIDPDVPVVLSSGYDETEATLKFKGKGLAAFLQKPYTARGLAETIKAVSREKTGSLG